MIYLDHNATTPVLPEVVEAMMPYFREEWGNPSSSYRFGSKLRKALETAREQVADFIGAHPLEIIFTSGGTESDNTALHAMLRADLTKRHLITSAVEHSAVLSFCRGLEEMGFRITYLPVDRDGLLSLTDLEAAITPDTVGVSLMAVNNETGVLFPTEEIAAICRERSVLFHCDAVQSVGKMPLNVKSLSVDYLALSGHKIGAPKGIGALYVRRKAPFTSFVSGGHQERGRRGGTENVAFVAGLGVAAAHARKKLDAFARTVLPLRDALETDILAAVPGSTRNGHADRRLANTTNLHFPGLDSEALLLLLDQAGICASSGSACLADSPDPSHVIAAMKPGAAAHESIRFSLGVTNTMAEVQETISAVSRIVGSLETAR
ncbi:MAG TPA: aminotransferase class V-fold PLP-dependent enzyme [Chthoniobacterales bacterium]